MITARLNAIKTKRVSRTPMVSLVLCLETVNVIVVRIDEPDVELEAHSDLLFDNLKILGFFG